MVDSDDEYDRKRRDKFRGERSTGGGDNYRVDRRDDRRMREDWNERSSFRGRGGRPGPDYYRGGTRERYSPMRDLPPPKRMRPGPDWNEDRPRYPVHDAYGMYGWGHEHYPMHGMHSFVGHSSMPPGHNNKDLQGSSDLQTQPPMFTLKQFLETQDDAISDAEVLRKYSEYKVEFKRQQLNEFFVAHKDEEWFKNKYHPVESSKRKEEHLNYLKQRVKAFTELLDKGMITQVSVDANQADQLLRLLDTVVIKLEGGTEEDLKALDEKPVEVIQRKIMKEPDDDIIITSVKPKPKDNVEMSWEPILSKMKENSKKNEDEENWDNLDNGSENKAGFESDHDGNWSTPENKPNEKDDIEQEGNWEDLSIKKTKNKNNEENWDDDNESSNPELIIEQTETINKPKEDKIELDGNESDGNQKKDLFSPRKRRTSSESSYSSEDVKKETEPSERKQNLAEDNAEEEQSNILPKNNQEEKLDESEKSTKPDEIVDISDIPDVSNDQNEINEENKVKDDCKSEIIDSDQEKKSESVIEIKPRALHRTSSIFLRNLAPAITKAEIETICKKYDGFLRVAIADPLVERRWFRRGWVTFQRDVNIKEICWNLNNIRLRDCEMGAIVNRDLSRRVRSVNGITAHKTIVRNDIKLLAKIAFNFDEKLALWDEKTSETGDNKKNADTQKEKSSFGFKSSNPVFQNITDYLIEEASAEEEELLGLSSTENNSIDGEVLDRDPQLIVALDKLILYMRIVHSVDFYNHCEYPYEDEMPNRCGIIHARGPPPSNKITKQDIEDYIKNFESKMSSFLTKTASIDEEELKNLGCKDPEAEVEKFVQANTQEISKDKWLCPLSGKKFKGPEFIRKHIFNKHMEKIEEVRKEVEYYNNYLKDSKRPQLPEHPGNTKRNQVGPEGGGGVPQFPYRPGYPAPMYASTYTAYAPPIIAPPRPRAFGNRSRGPGGSGGDFRPMIHYKDLDAPNDSIDIL